MARQLDVPYYSDPSIGGGYGSGIAYGGYVDAGGAGGGGGFAPVEDVITPYRLPDAEVIRTPRPISEGYKEPATNTAAPVPMAASTAMKRAGGKTGGAATTATQADNNNNSLAILAGLGLLLYFLTKD